MQSRNEIQFAIMSADHIPLIAHDHMRAHGMTSSYLELLAYITSFAGLEKPDEESVGLVSYEPEIS